jgi:hypothetical protein
MSDERDERMAAEDDTKEDLELNDESAEQVRGGLISKGGQESVDATGWK